MEYQQDIIINLPRNRVIELFDNTENLKKWQDGLQSFEHLSGEAGQEGAKSKMLFKMGKREVEMIETITKRNLPEEFHGTYEAKGVFNKQENFFSELDENKTKWTSNTEFQFSGFMKLIYPLMKGAFKKQSYKFMENFKRFAEND